MEKKSPSLNLKSHLNLSSKKGPAIRALFHIEKKQLTKISLALAECFSYEILGECPLSLQVELEAWIQSYLNHAPLSFSLPLESLAPFKKRALLSLLNVSFGKTKSYSEIAELIGSQKASRAVGNACKTNPWPWMVPCHRILPKDQTLGQYNGGCEIKKRLLQFEKAFFKEV